MKAAHLKWKPFFWVWKPWAELSKLSWMLDFDSFFNWVQHLYVQYNAQSRFNRQSTSTPPMSEPATCHPRADKYAPRYFRMSHNHLLGCWTHFQLSSGKFIFNNYHKTQKWTVQKLGAFFGFRWNFDTFSPVACRGLAMPGATAWLDATLQNSGIEQWRMVVIVSGYTLFVTSYLSLLPTFWRSLLTQHADLATQEKRLGRGSSKAVQGNGNL